MAYRRGWEAQGPAPATTGRADGGAEGLDANMAIVLAALFLALMFAVGLNSLSRCALLRRWGRRGDAAPGSGGGVKVKKRALRRIPVEVYGRGGPGGEEAQEGEVCAICLGEFADGEKVRVLPRCGHGFHVRCVDAWLLSRGSCPTCRRPVTGDALEKGDGGGGGVGQSSRPPDGDAIAVVVT